MHELEVLSHKGLSARVQQFVNEASDLYVGFLSEGRKTLATSLLSGLVLVVATLEKISQLAPGSERSRQMGNAAELFHRLSLLIFVSAVYDEEDDYADMKTQHAYDTAADLSGLLAAASRRH